MKYPPKFPRLNPQDLVNKERSFLKIIKNGMVQILALLPGRDAFSQEELKKLHEAIFQAIVILSDIYKMELEKVPINSIIIEHNLEIINKVKSLFMQRKYETVSRLLKNLQS